MFIRPELESTMFLLSLLKGNFFGSNFFTASFRNKLMTNTDFIKFQRESREIRNRSSERKPNFGTLLLTSVKWWWIEIYASRKGSITRSAYMRSLWESPTWYSTKLFFARVVTYFILYKAICWSYWILLYSLIGQSTELIFNNLYFLFSITVAFHVLFHIKWNCNLIVFNVAPKHCLLLNTYQKISL